MLMWVCVMSESVSFEFMWWDGGATTRCVFASYDVVCEVECVSVNVMVMKVIFVECDVNVEIFV